MENHVFLRVDTALWSFNDRSVLMERVKSGRSRHKHARNTVDLLATLELLLLHVYTAHGATLTVSLYGRHSSGALGNFAIRSSFNADNGQHTVSPAQLTWYYKAGLLIPVHDV